MPRLAPKRDNYKEWVTWICCRFQSLNYFLVYREQIFPFEWFSSSRVIGHCFNLIHFNCLHVCHWCTSQLHLNHFTLYTCAIDVGHNLYFIYFVNYACAIDAIQLDYSVSLRCCAMNLLCLYSIFALFSMPNSPRAALTFSGTVTMAYPSLVSDIKNILIHIVRLSKYFQNIKYSSVPKIAPWQGEPLLSKNHHEGSKKGLILFLPSGTCRNSQKLYYTQQWFI